jgi:cytochrome P450
MLTDRRFGAVAMPTLSLSGVTGGPLYDLWNALMFGKDGAEHRRIRTVVSSFFTRAGVERQRAAVIANANELAASLPDDQPFDLWISLRCR